MKYLIHFFGIVASFTCCSTHSNTKANTIVSEKEYDSVKYYRDVEWPSLRGYNELAVDHLEYPYAAFAYAGTSLDIHIAFSKDRSKVIHFATYKDYMVARDSFSDPEEAHQIRYKYSILNRDGSMIILETSAKELADSLKVTLVRKEELKDSSVLSQRFFTGNASCSLNDIVSFNYDKLAKSFHDYGEENSVIEDQALFIIHTADHDFSTGEMKENNQKVVSVKKMPFASFFYFYYND